MKKMSFIFLLLILSVFAFGQQALWSTVKNNKIKNIPDENVTKEVLEFYDMYKFYFDFTGFNKETFKEKFSGNFKGDEENWDWINDIEERAVFALRTPIEGGSAIAVLCIDKNNFHMVIFSNVYDSGANMTYNGEIEKERKRFEKWFNTLLD
jgi:hypothetical protein